MTVRLRQLALVLTAAGAAGAAAARPADDRAGLAPVPAATPVDPVAVVLRDLDARLLAGEALPPDFIPGLWALPPADRLLAVAYARRAGLLEGPALPLGDLLAPGTRP